MYTRFIIPNFINIINEFLILLTKLHIFNCCEIYIDEGSPSLVIFSSEPPR